MATIQTQEKRVYQHAPPYDHGYLQVSELHRLHYEQYGNRDGKPVVFLHGGPGGSTSINSTTYFDPAVYRVVLFDQRGAGRSEPSAELRENTSQHLVADIEKLREHFGVAKWHMVFGGSWGSTLGLLYAETHPERVGSLVLRGIFCGTEEEMNIISSPRGACARLYPEDYEVYIQNLRDAGLPADKESDYSASYYKLMTSDDPAVRLKGAKDYGRGFAKCGSVDPGPDPYAKLEDDAYSLAHGRLESHYTVNMAFLAPNQIQNDLHKIHHIPCSMVQGRYDLICNPITAYRVHKLYPGSELHMIPGAGHAAGEPGNHNKLINICDRYGKEDFHKS